MKVLGKFLHRAEIKSFWDSVDDIKRCEPDCECDYCTELQALRKQEAAERIERNLTRPARRLRVYFPK
jgi:hypothetical protein